MKDKLRLKELLNRFKYLMEKNKKIEDSEEIAYYFKARRDDANEVIAHHKKEKNKVKYKID